VQRVIFARHLVTDLTSFAVRLMDWSLWLSWVVSKCSSGCQKVLIFGINSLKQTNFLSKLIDCLCAPRISTTYTRASPYYKRGIFTKAPRSSCTAGYSSGWFLHASPPSYRCNQKLPGTELNATNSRALP